VPTSVAASVVLAIFPQGYPMSEHHDRSLTRRALLAVILGALLVLSYWVLRPFLVPVAWAGILSFVSWPAYRRLRLLLRGRATASALLMTVLLAAAFVAPSFWLAVRLRWEVADAYLAVAGRLSAGSITLPGFVDRIPWVGPLLENFLVRVAGDPVLLTTELAGWVERWGGQLAELVGGVGRSAGKLGVAVLTAFFCYRDGESLMRQLRRVLLRFLGERTDAYLRTVGGTSKAVVYGLILSALAQGALAGLGYWVAGLAAPVLSGALTALAALIPFGAAAIWVPLGVWLLLTGEPWMGIGLLAWGAVFVSWVDNLVRPLVISNSTRIPFLFVLFGVVGGGAAFGLVGLFVGPVILAVLLAVWREWLEESEEGADPEELSEAVFLPRAERISSGRAPRALG
jgi:predicted PurR-regulated permease PerM